MIGNLLFVSLLGALFIGGIYSYVRQLIQKNSVSIESVENDIYQNFDSLVTLLILFNCLSAFTYIIYFYTINLGILLSSFFRWISRYPLLLVLSFTIPCIAIDMKKLSPSIRNNFVLWKRNFSAAMTFLITVFLGLLLLVVCSQDQPLVWRC